MANRKKKKQAMSLGEFHATVAGGNEEASVPSAQPSSVVRINWADEMEALDEDSPQGPQFVFDRSKLPTAPKSVRQSELDLELVPKKGPFKAFLGNISFEADEEKVKNFFRDLKVVSVTLTIDQAGRSKGTGTVEFEDRESLIAALNKNESMLNNRQLRISLMEPRSGFGDRSGGGYGRGGDRTDGEPLKSDENNWRREEQPAEPEQSSWSGRQQSDKYQSGGDRRGGYGGNRGYGGDRGGDRGNDRGGYQRRGGYENRAGYENRGGERTYGNRGPRHEEAGTGKQYGGYNRDEQRENRSEGENAWTRSTEPVVQAPPPREPEPAAPSAQVVTERPKLQLKPRTLPVEEVGAPVAASSIFGAAKPVNTAAREREIEERMKSEGTKQDQEEEGKERRVSEVSEDNTSHNSITSPQQKISNKPTENAWKSRQSSDLFSGQEKGSNVPASSVYGQQGQRSGYAKRGDSNQSGRGGGERGYNNNRDRRGGHGGDSRGGNRGGRGGYNERQATDKFYKNYNETKTQNDEAHDIGFVNKFAHLEVDVDEVE